MPDAISSTPNLTAVLLASSPDAFSTATQCPFLVRAGKGTLDKQILQTWLGCDRLYAQAYVRFAGLLLANVPLLPGINGECVNERLQDLLVDSLTNIRRELKFFEDVAQRYGLSIEVPEAEVSEGVKAYRGLFAEVSEGLEAGTVEMLDAMLVLWGTEKCYLQAWRYAASFSSSSGPKEDRDGGALRKEFIPNWTSSEFEVFVDQIGEMVDSLWEGGQGGFIARMNPLIQTKEVREERVLKLWARLLEVERIFWPSLDVDDQTVRV